MAFENINYFSRKLNPILLCIFLKGARKEFWNEYYQLLEIKEKNKCWGKGEHYNPLCLFPIIFVYLISFERSVNIFLNFVVNPNLALRRCIEKKAEMS